MINRLVVAPHICEIVARLQAAGYETYVVGGAIRDLLLGRTPKDYDVSTAATPEEVRAVFGRRSARIIGKRFKLVHLSCGKEIIEISTFRQAPDGTHLPPKLRRRREELPENMILDDNQFGTAEEDAWRRDFSVNALFLDPNGRQLLDHTGLGIQDMENGVVRAIGDPKLRFEEDPVRMLRALKLVGQYGFSLEKQTEAALVASLPLIQHAAQSRLALELEKIMRSTYSDRILTVFRRYGFLKYFLPFFAARWDTVEMQYAMRLLQERNLRVERGCYRNSISIAMATLVLPFVESRLGEAGCGKLWESKPGAPAIIGSLLNQAFVPHALVKRVTFSTCRILLAQPALWSGKWQTVAQQRGYGHAREMMLIQNEVSWHLPDLERSLMADSGVTAGNGKTRRRRRKKKPASAGAEPAPAVQPESAEE